MKQGKHMQFLGPVDTAFYMVDTPETPMNIGAMTIFEGGIPFDEFSRLIEARIYQIPLYQQKVIQAPLSLGQPMWAFDPDFYVGNHVFKLTLDAPGTDEQLRELAGHLVSGKLDRSKPLWEIYLIEGLDANRTAVFFKIHHCMVDGLAAIELFTLLLDISPDTAQNPKKPVYDPPNLPDTGQLIIESIKRDIPHKFNMLRKVGEDVLSLGSVLADKEQRRKALIGVAYLLNDNLKPIKKLAINGKNTGRMALGWAEFSLAEVRAIRSGRSASINDVMLTVLGGAVEQYVRDQGDKTSHGFLRALVPVNVRTDEQKGDFGNRISVLPIDIPFGVSDPLERLRLVAEYTSVMKNSALSKGLDMVLTFPSLMPSLSQPLIWQVAPVAFALLAHTWCTNVAGPQIPIYLLGHEMLHTFGYFPLNPSNGLACVITSYNQKISMTLVTDAGIVPDVTELLGNLKDAYYALRSAAKVPAMPPPAPKAAEAKPAAPPAGEPKSAAANPAAGVTPTAPALAAAEVKPAPQPDVPAPVAAAVEAVVPQAAAPVTQDSTALPEAPADEVRPAATNPAAEVTPTAPALAVVEVKPAPQPDVPAPVAAAVEAAVPQAAALATDGAAASPAGETKPAATNPAAEVTPTAPALAVVELEPATQPDVPAPVAAAVEAAVPQAASHVEAPSEPVESAAAVEVSAVELTGAPVEAAPALEQRSNGFQPAADLESAPVVGGAIEPPATNGIATPDTAETPAPTVPQAAPPAEPQPAPPQKPKLFSEEWAQVYREAINGNKAYYAASTRWDAGALTFIMKASPRHGFARDSAVWLDLYKGVCRAAKSIPLQDAEKLSAFVIEGEYATWMDVLGGRAQPLVMIMRGKLRLKKGSMTRLLPFTQSAQELIHSAQAIS